MESHLNRQALNPWDVAGGLKPTHDNFVDRYLREKVEDEAPRQNYISTLNQALEDNPYWVGHNQLFYQVLSPVTAEGGLRATARKAEQRLNRNWDFLSDPLAQSHLAESSRGEAMAEEKHSSQGGHLLIMPATTDTQGKQQEEGSMFIKKSGRPQGPDLALVPGELLNTTVHHHLHLLEPDEGLWAFMGHVEQALRTGCSLPQIKQACARTFSKIGLLLKELSERQETQGASDRMGQCPLQDNISRRTALQDQEPAEKPRPETVDDTITFVVLLSLIAIILLILKCVFHVCSRCAAAICRQLPSWKSWLRRLSIKLKQRWRKNKYRDVEDAEQDLPELSEAELLVVQYIMDVLDKEEEELQKQMQKENTDVSQEEIQHEELE
ncbi:uncharacterized protein LOC107215240 [Parus major]|uniref:uncharacterized protein LOC107215240 n=1 Tax=Parus major TaxID=9157 RepID=UPI0007712678|nr:uncharacterized protein LOC107215240 [Parus major]